MYVNELFLPETKHRICKKAHLFRCKVYRKPNSQLLPGLKRLAFTIPVSMTYLIPEIVTDVSAMLVDRMTFLLPWNRRQREHFQSGKTATCN